MFVFQLSHFIHEFVYLFSLSSPLDMRSRSLSLARHHLTVDVVRPFWLKPLWHGADLTTRCATSQR